MKKMALFLAALFCAMLCGCEQAVPAPAPTPMPVQTPQPEILTSGAFRYILLEDGTAKIVHYSSTTSLSVFTIPHMMGDYPVSAIGDGAFSTNYFTELIIPDSITVLEGNPFRGMRHLTRLTVSPEHPTLESIDGVLFDRNEKRLICYPSGIPNETYAIPEGTRIIGKSAFDSCSTLTGIAIPGSVITIGDWAFLNCRQLTTLVIEDGVVSIDQYAFAQCEALSEIRLPDSVTSIGDYAFYDCDALTEIVIPKSVTSIGRNPFQSCSLLTNITVADGNPALQVLDGVLFDRAEHRLIFYPVYSTAKSYTVPDGTRIIEESAFRYAVHLKEIILPDSLSVIGSQAFSGCESLLSITVPDDVTDIGQHAFQACVNMTSLVLGDSVSFIGYCAFNRCISLTEIILPDSVTYIDEAAFANCSSVRSIRLPDSNALIETAAFSGCESLREITIPDGLLYFGGNPFPNCSALTDIRISPDHPTMELIDGVLFHRVEKQLIFCPPSLGLVSYAVPEGTLSIAPYAFRGCESLTQVTIPDGLTYIGRSAFNYCHALDEIRVPGSVTSVGADAFSRVVSTHIDYGSLVLIIEPDSYMEEYARRADIPYRYATEE